MRSSSNTVTPAFDFNAYTEKKLLRNWRDNRRVYKYTDNTLLIYQSGGDTTTHNNCKLVDAGGALIKCDRSAIEFLYRDDRTQGMHYGTLFSSQKAIDSHPIRIKTTMDGHRFRARAHRHIHMPSKSNGLGRGLALLAEDLKPGDKKRLILESDCHAMGIILKRKMNGIYTVKFYDPNISCSHVRGVFKNIAAIQTFALSDIMNTSIIYEYFNTYQSMVFMDCTHVDLTKDKDDSVEIECHDWSIQSATSVLFHSMSTGKYRSVEKAITFITQICGDNNERLLHRMRATKETGTTALYMAFQNGHTAAVNSYLQLLAVSPLTSTQKFECLKGISASGSFGLRSALNRNHSDAVICYIRHVANATYLSHEQKFELIQAKSDAHPCLYSAVRALEFGQAIQSYINEIIIGDWISNKMKCQLLTARCDVGANIVQALIFDGNTDNLIKYMESIISLKHLLSPDEIISILELTPDKISGYRELGKHEALDTYLNIRDQFIDAMRFRIETAGAPAGEHSQYRTSFYKGCK
ncbi:MAG: ShET2/EspL2 family type III secretion system effector toxin [Coxiellaceae bacterium]|nr:ShET2/EspL2 family type III secretion system effector toxin [Coxiellaceae bacterium]